MRLLLLHWGTLLGWLFVLDCQPKIETQQAQDPVPGLLKGLQAKDSTVRVQALRKLARLGPGAAKAVPALVETLGDPDEAVARQAAQALIRIGPKSLAVIAKVLDSQNLQRSALALSVIEQGNWDDKLAVPLLIKGLRSRWSNVRGRAASELQGRGLQGTRDERAILALIQVVRADPVKDVRQEAIFALASFQDKAAPAIPTLVELIEKEKGDAADVIFLSVDAANALADIGDKAVPALLALAKDAKKDPIVRSEALRSLHLMSAKHAKRMKVAVPILVALLRERNADLRWYAVSVLGRLGRTAHAALPALEQFIKKAPAKEQTEAAEAMFRISGDAQAVLPILLRLLRGPDARARSAAAAAIGVMGPAAKSAIPALITACQDKAADVRLQAVLALRDMGPLPEKALSAIRGLLHDEEETVRMSAKTALEWQGQKP
jgi:HEAT repeat protein